MNLNNNSVKIRFDKDYKVKSLEYNISEINNNLSDIEKVQYINYELKTLHNILENSNTLKFESMELINNYQLTNNFISQIGNINNENDINDEYKINNYNVEIYGSYSDDDDSIFILFEIK